MWLSIGKVDDKKDDFIRTYVTLMKNFMVVFERIFGHNPEYYDGKTEKLIGALQQGFEKIQENH